MITRKIARYYIYFILLSIIIINNASSQEPDKLHNLTARINGIDTSISLKVLENSDSYMLDAKQFSEAIGATFIPSYKNIGFTIQLGNRFSSFRMGLDYGCIQTQILKLNDKIVFNNGTFWISNRALSSAINGSVKIDNDHIDITFPKPQQIGDIIPEAKSLSENLMSNDFALGQGAISLSKPIDFCLAKLTPDANANNGSFPYYAIQVPPAPSNSHPLSFLRFLFQLGKNEAIIIIGRTPPECDYFSYRSYLVNICTDKQHPAKRTKIYTQLGDPINNYNFNQPVIHHNLKSPTANKSSFERFFVLISTANKNMYDQIVAAAINAGISEEDILLDVINTELTEPGNNIDNDILNFLHRVSIVKDKDKLAEYNKQPSLEIIRVSASKEFPFTPLQPFPPRTRGSGTNENYLQPALKSLHQAIINKYSPNYIIQEMNTNVWLGDSGRSAIEKRENVLGETRDTLYRKTDSFSFGKDTIILAYGVNHKRSNKSVYSNVSVYGDKILNGIGSITNYMYDANVTENYPELKDIDNIDQLYIWKFARNKLDDSTFVINPDTEKNLRGFDYDEKVFVGFRSYVDPTNTPSLIGPSFDEIIPERVLILTPK